MNNENKKALLFVCIIRSLLKAYEQKEKTKLHKEIELRISKGIKKQYQAHSKDTLEIIALGDKVWTMAGKHFKDTTIHIEASNLVARIHMQDEKRLAKNFGLGKGIIVKWCKPYRDKDAYEVEKSTKKVVDYLVATVNDMIK